MSIPSNNPAGCVSVIEYPVASEGRTSVNDVGAVNIGLHRHVDDVAQIVDAGQRHIHPGNAHLTRILHPVIVQILEHRPRQRWRRQLTKVIPTPASPDVTGIAEITSFTVASPPKDCRQYRSHPRTLPAATR